VDPAELKRLHQRYGSLIRPITESRKPHSPSVGLGDPLPERPELREQLRHAFEANAGIVEIFVLAGDDVVGIADRVTVFRPVGHAQGESAASGSLGDSGGATLPGLPVEFRTFPVRCRECGAEFVCLHHGPPMIDSCSVHPRAAAKS
jgi:hypothetical protein